MPLKAILDEETFQTLDPVMQAHYAKVDDEYRLQVEAVNGWSLDDVTGLKKVLQEAKADRKALREKLKGYDGLDVDAARDALAKIDEVANWTPADKVAEVVDRETKKLIEKHAAEVKAKEERETSLIGALDDLLIRSEAVSALAKHKGNEDLLLPIILANAVREEVEGKHFARVRDGDGNIRMTQKQGSHAPMEIAEFVESMTKDPRYQVAFEGSEATGSGFQNRKGGGGASGFTLSESDAADPQKYQAARKKAQEAGQTVQII